MIHSYQAKLLEKKHLAGPVYRFSFSPPQDQNWTFQAGQYMIFQIPQADGYPLRRLYSVASPPSQKNTLTFIIEMVEGGIGTTYINNMAIGDSLTMQGPAGLFTYKPSERPVIFLATGTGIAPMYSMLAEHLKTTMKQDTYLLWGLKKCSDIYLFEELTLLANTYPQFHMRTCLSRETDLSAIAPEHMAYTLLGRVTKGLEELTTSYLSYDYYLCGSKHVVESLRTDLTEKGVPKEHVYFEKFT